MMRMVILGLLFVSHSVISQTQYVFTRYNQDDGLASNKIQSVTEDSHGFIWLTSEEGLTRFDNYTFKTYVNDVNDVNSLPDNSVQKIIFDTKGTMLVKTKSGLSRYDARNDNFVQLYSFSDTTEALFFEAGTNNDVWICTPRSFIDLDIYKGTSKSYAFPDDFFKPPYKNIKTRLQDNRLWIYYDNDQLFFDLIKQKFIHVSFENDLYNTTSEDQHDKKEILFSQGKLYLINRFGLFQFSEMENKFRLFRRNDIPGIENTSVQTIIKQDENSVIFSTQNHDFLKFYFADGNVELIKIHTADGKYFSLIDGTVSALKDEDGSIWITTDGTGVLHYYPENNLIQQFVNIPGDANSISSNSVIYSFRDHSGVFWFACRGDGLVKLELIQQLFHAFSVGKKNFTTTPTDYENVRALCEYDHDHFLIGTLKGLYSFSKIDSSLIQPSWWSTDNQGVGALLKDSEGKIWIGLWGKPIVMMYDPRIKKLISFTLNNESPTVYCKIVRSIIEDKQKNIWIGTVCGLFKANRLLIDSSVIKSELIVHKFQSNDSNFIANAAIYSFLTDNKNRLWLGTSDGLNLIDLNNNSFKKIIATKYTSDGFRVNNIRSLLQDHNGLIWIGTNGGGLSSYNENKKPAFRTYTMKDGLPSEAIYAIQEDSEGFLYLSTKRGLCRFDAQNTSCSNFKFSDGLQNSEFNTNASLKTTEGELIFGGVNGFNFFNPKNITKLKLQEPVTITSVKVFDHSIPFDTSIITLAHDQNYISIEFAARSHFRVQDIQYAYMLEGEDKDWIFSGKRRYVSYTNLNHGNYIFHVRISDSNSPLSSESILSFQILPPWYRTPLAIFLFIVVILFSLFLIHRFQHVLVIRKERATARIREAELKSEVLEEKNRNTQQELEKAKELEKAYNQLKAAQNQLVQQEKLASLGQLTAGIAHEIKNPLNFVSNFSELSITLLDEFRNANSEEERSSLLNELQQNLEKINRHGKRADSIVKNMLQHSRSGSGEKQLTDINQLCEEFLNLAFHGMRAGHNDFQTDIVKNFAAELPKANVFAQDISRVLLNIFNNAFHAVQEKDKMESAALSFRAITGTPYKPKISVSTEFKNQNIIIKVRDNGSGIPESIKQKIFEPFFTTKPAGIGTGLGLSLSYDIVKTHGGEIKVESKMNEFTEFTITIPVNS